MGQGHFFPAHARSPVPGSLSPGFCFFPHPYSTPNQHSPGTGLPAHLEFYVPDCACRGHVMASRQERPQKEDTGLCSQLPHVHRSKRAQPLLRQLSSELGVEPPTSAQTRRWAQRSRPHRSRRRPGAKASRRDRLSHSGHRAHSPSPRPEGWGCSVPSWPEQECSFSVPSRAQHTSRCRAVLTTLCGLTLEPPPPGLQCLLAQGQAAVVA